jgi:chaperonin GroEL (HSP60 family)
LSSEVAERRAERRKAEAVRVVSGERENGHIVVEGGAALAAAGNGH